MDSSRSSAATIDEYLTEFPPETREVLEEVRALIKTAAPETTETMSYAIPTFDLNGHLVHFAGYERHIGFYPGPSGIAAFKEELKPYKRAKGSVQFPLDRPLPMDLIRRMVEYRVAENAGKTSTRRSATGKTSTRRSAARRSAARKSSAREAPARDTSNAG